jgi:membrane peptidoglycan carboxypeptidase
MSSPRPTSGGQKIGKSLLTMGVVSAICGVLVAGLMLPFASLVGITTQNVAEGFHDLPLELAETPTAQRSTVLDVHGEPIAYFYNENRQDIALDKVAPIMKQAILAIEDYRFYEHGALDIKGTIRALINNQAGESVQGGSSITQQLVKMILLSQADTKRERMEVIASDGMDGYARKIRELKYAMAYEESHTKDEIFEDYLNFAYFGDGAYGIDEAANHYFSVQPSELTLKQAALLAGLVKNPSAYNPTQFPEAAADRRNTVLARMAQLDIITDDQARSIYNTPLGMDLSYRSNGCVSTEAPFFCDYLREWLLTEKYLGDTRDEREFRLETAGLTINTTLDLQYQEAADEAVRSHVYRNDRAIGALAMVEPGTGEVRALAQSRPMGSDKNDGYTYLNYLVPPEYGDSGGFQAGSTFKAFVLATALKKGYPTSTEFASPTTITMPNYAFTMCNGLHPADDWTVSSSTGSGTFDMYDGTQQSINTYYAQLEALVGVCPSARLAQKMGVHVDTKGRGHRDDLGPFTLGVSSTNPLSMSAAYATFAARGTYCEPQPVTDILDRFGKPVVTVPKDCERVFPRAVGDAVNDILRGVQEDPSGFGYLNNLTLEVPSAAKTGTIQDNKSVWYMGYTEDLSTAAMIAGANRDGHPITLVGQTVGGSGVTEDIAFGSTLAGPMWYDAMSVIQKWLKGRDFHPPNESKLGGKVQIVPGTSGMSIGQAKDTLRASGFKPIVGSYQNSEYAEGTVAFTDPGEGEEAYEGQTVTIYPSTGYVPPPPEEDNGDNGDNGGDGGDNGDNGGPTHDNGGGNDRGPGGGPGGGGD